MVLALRRQISPAFVVGGLIVLLCALFGEALSQIDEQTRSLVHLRVERDALSQVDILRQIVLEAETGQRVHLLTGAAAYLAPFQPAEASLPPALKRLSGGLAGADQEMALAGAISAAFAELRETLDARARSGPMIEERAAILLGRLRLPGQDALSPAVAAHEFAGSAGLFGILGASELARCCERALHTVSPDAARLGDLQIRALEDTQPPLRAAPGPRRRTERSRRRRFTRRATK